MTAPLSGSHAANTVIGYSFLLEGGPIQAENISPPQNALAFNGYFSDPDGYYLRPFYPFLLSLVSPFVGLIAAALAINYLAYATLVVATGWLAFRLTGRLTPALAASSLVLVGLGPIMHLNDYSAHLLSYAFYAVVVLVVYETRIWCIRRPLLVHVRIGCLLALASLTYPIGGILSAAYVLTALPRSPWYAVALAAGMGLLARTVWERILTGAYGRFFDLAQLDLYRIDFGASLVSSLDTWLQLWHTGSSAFFGGLAQILADCVFVAFPPVTLLGLVALVVVGRRSPRRLWGFLVLFVLPYFGVVLFGHGAGARGYIAYGSMVLLYATLAVWLVNSPPSTPSRLAVWGVFAVLVTGQAAWGLAHLYGYYFPMRVASYLRVTEWRSLPQNGMLPGDVGDRGGLA